jgi:ferritin
MKKLTYPLKEEALSLLEELLELEFDQSYTWTYIAMCMQNNGYFRAADYFSDEAKEERGHAGKHIEYLLGRGYEAKLPKIVAPELDLEDLKGAIKYGFELESEVTDKYVKITRKIFDIDLITYNFLLQFLTIQMDAVAKYSDLYSQIDSCKDAEAQKEMEKWIFGHEAQESMPGPIVQ